MTINWGILGPGNVAHLVAADLALLPDAQLTPWAPALKSPPTRSAIRSACPPERLVGIEAEGGLPAGLLS